MRDTLFEEPGQQRKTLRPHQAEAIRMIRSSLGKGFRRVVLQGPVGFGKTLVSANIIEGALSKGKRVIFTAPMISLIDQTVEAFEAEGLRDLGVMQSNHPRTDRLARVQIASVQTLAKRLIPDAALVIVDEAHLQSRVIDKLMDERPDVFFIGLTATPWAKGMGLRWQDLVIPCTVGSLIDTGFLSKFTAFAPDVPDLSRVRTERGDYAEGQLAQVMGDKKLVGSVVATWLEKGEDRPTLVFGVNRAHAQQLRDDFERAGVATAYVDGEVDRIMRERIGGQFKRGEVRVICSVRTMTTGVDLPVSCIVDAAPTKSEILHCQKIGRGLRVNEGTEDLLILDHAGNSLRLGLITDIEHSELDKTKPGAKQETKPKAEKLPKPCSGCGVLFVGLKCPACGKERKPPSLSHADGSLVQISGKRPQVPMEVKMMRYEGLLWIARERGYKPGWAFHKYTEWHGVQPPSSWRDRPPHPPMAEVSNWVTSRQIAWAKSKDRQRVS